MRLFKIFGVGKRILKTIVESSEEFLIYFPILLMYMSLLSLAGHLIHGKVLKEWSTFSEYLFRLLQLSTFENITFRRVKNGKNNLSRKIPYILRHEMRQNYINWTFGQPIFDVVFDA